MLIGTRGWRSTTSTRADPVPTTPLRAVRMPDEIWFAAKHRAIAEGRTITSVVREALLSYGLGDSASFPEPEVGTYSCIRCGEPIDYGGERFVYCRCLQLNQR